MALQLDADNPGAPPEPGEDGAEAPLEPEDPTVQGDERRPVGVAVPLEPEGMPSISSWAMPSDGKRGADSSVVPATVACDHGACRRMREWAFETQWVAARYA